MKNKELAGLFDEMADMLEFTGDNPFRVRSYKRAAQIINGLPDDVGTLYRSGRLSGIKGIGEGLQEKIAEFLATGTIEKHDELKTRVPPGITEMMAIPSLGPVTLRTLHRQLHIETVDGLLKACEEHRVRTLPGFGPKKEENILKGIMRFREASQRFPIGRVYEDVMRLLNDVRQIQGVRRAEVAGSFRRMKETVGDIDILAAGSDSALIIKEFSKNANIREILAEGGTKASVILDNGIQADIRVVEERSFGAALQYFTGSKEHNVNVRSIAKDMGFKINEYGVWRGERSMPGEDEAAVYKLLGMTYIPPELRENTGEVELAQKDELPRIIGYDDIKGDVHVHSQYSDGGETILAMAEAAIRKGYEYIVITDHSRSLKIARGLEAERLFKQREEIVTVNKKLRPFRVFAGSEVEIKTDGSLDYPDDILKGLDFVIASIHSGFKESETVITQRIIRVMENPYVTLIAHPTGRIINARDPYQVDLLSVFKKAAETGTYLEMNAYFDRLDLNDINARIARGHGVKFCIGTDAHNSAQYAMMRYGIGQARRAWLTKKDIINTLPLREFVKAITIKRK